MRDVSDEILKAMKTELLDAVNAIKTRYGIQYAKYQKGDYVVLVRRRNNFLKFFSIGQTLKVDGTPYLDEYGEILHWLTDGNGDHYNFYEEQLKPSDESLFMPKMLDFVKKAKSILKIL